jgi:GcrA cell cycle regulator
MNVHFADPRQPTWTNERVQLLIELWTSGHSCSVIAKTIGGNVTRNAVIGKTHRLGLAGRRVAVRMSYPSVNRGPWSDERKARERKRRAALPKKEKKPPAPRVRAKVSRPPEFNPDPRNLDLGAWDALADSRPVSLVDLEAGMCRWPIGTDSPYLFCGCQVVPGKSYCGTHVERARGKGTESERAAHRGSKRADIGTGDRWA